MDKKIIDKFNMISNWELFLENRFLQRIDEAKFYYSPDISKILDHLRKNSTTASKKIANDLWSLNEEVIDADITLLDIGEDGYFSFLSERTFKNRIGEFIKPNFAEDEEGLNKKAQGFYEEPLWVDGICWQNELFKKNKQSVRIGKLINRLFPNKYTSDEVSNFVLDFKASQMKKEKFEIVSGEDIDYWYNSKNYLLQIGDLGNSCMKKANFFDIYTKNPQVCKMLILTEFDKLKGRALLWNVVSNQGFTLFMDRQYTNYDYDVKKFTDWATNNGYAYRTFNSFGKFSQVTFNGNKLYAEMSVNLKNIEYRSFPYMDTFRSYVPDEYCLYNTQMDSGCYLLNSTEGYYEDRYGVWSDYYDTSIPTGEEVWSEPLNSYIYANNSCDVEYGSRIYRGCWPEDHHSICYSDYMSSYLHKDDSLMSKTYRTWILAEDSVKVTRFSLTMRSEQLPSNLPDLNDWSPLFDYVPLDDEDYLSSEDIQELVDLSETAWYASINRINQQKKLPSFPAWYKVDFTSDFNMKLIPIKWTVKAVKTEYNNKECWLHEDDYLFLSDKLNLDKLDYESPILMDVFSYNNYLNKLKLFEKLDEETIENRKIFIYRA